MIKKALLVLVLLNAAGVYGQSKLRLGVHLDPLITWFSPKTSRIERDGSRLGISGGLMLEYYFLQNYGFSTGLSLTALGGNLLYNDSVNITTDNSNTVQLEAGSTLAYRTSYLNIPIALKLKTNELGYFTYYAQLGLMQHISIGARATSTGNALSKDNVEKEINLFSMSYFFGGGLEYNVGGQTAITAGLFYYNGFIDVLSNNDYKAALNYLSFRLGILF
jgi:hypothetical protein